MFPGKLRYAWLVLSIAAGTATTAEAAIIGVEARVESSVQALIDGTPGSISSDSVEFGAESPELPIVSSAILISEDLGGELLARGESVSAFNDPTRLDRPNPAELGLELACFSNTPSLSYSVAGSTVESRRILFSSFGGEVPVEIAFSFDNTRLIESTVFFSGAIVLWATDAATELDAMSAEIRVTVTASGNPDPLFATSITIDGAPFDRSPPTTTGPIIVEEVSVEDLAAEGIDATAVAAIEQLAQSALVRVILVPFQEHTYSYMVTADRELTVTATMEASVRNAAGGSGAAVVLGRSFDMLSVLIEEAIPGIDGESLQASVNAANARRAIGAVATAAQTSGPQSSGVCGMFGAEAIICLWLAGFGALFGAQHPKLRLRRGRCI